jgi:hypothetical protein
VHYQHTFSVLLGALHPGIPIYLEAEVSDLPQVEFVFCSHATLPKHFALWMSRELKLVFTTALVRQRSRRWREWTAHSLCMDHAKLGGTYNRVSWISVFGHGLNLSGLTAPARAPREVSSVCQDHHFGIDAPPQLSQRHKNPVVDCVSPGVFHGDGLYPMTRSRSPYFLLRSKYALSGWCKRRLRVDELLQVYNVNDVICKRMTLQQRSQLVATPQLTPFKILVAATNLVLNILPGGAEIEMFVSLEGKLPAIVHTREMDYRAEPTGEVNELLRMGAHGELTRASLEEATKHDDAEVPIWLWNSRLKTLEWNFLEGREWESALVVIRSFGLRCWQRKVTSSFFLWFHKRYQVRPADKVIATWQKEKARYVCSAGQRRRYRAHWKNMREAKIKNDSGRNDMEAAKDCITRAAESSWWE